jgi:hypothetical protein
MLALFRWTQIFPNPLFSTYVSSRSGVVCAAGAFFDFALGLFRSALSQETRASITSRGYGSLDDTIIEKNVP